MYNHLLIATDGSEVAQHGVDQGLELAAKIGAKVTIITVTEPIPVLGGRSWAFSPAEVERYDAERLRHSAEILQPVAAAAAKLGIACETVHVSHQLPAEAILETAAEKGCDLIVMASHGRRGFTRLLLGSQTHEVVTQSKLPVLVVR